MKSMWASAAVSIFISTVVIEVVTASAPRWVAAPLVIAVIPLAVTLWATRSTHAPD